VKYLVQYHEAAALKAANAAASSARCIQDARRLVSEL
jgi:hypothetical protein